MATAAVALNLPVPALDDETSCLADAAAAAAGFKFESIDDYEMIEEIGEGTFGIVAKARDRRTGETVAVKWIRSSGEGGKPPAFLHAAALREASCLAACRGHPYIVDLRGLAADDATGDLFLIMEFVGPTTLSHHLTRPLTEAETRAAMRQLLAAAERMHGAGTVHRDIKPDNILVGTGGVLKVCDFGSATPARPLGKPYLERRVGTVQYNAPEQLLGIRRYGTAVDMWALGCVMAELLIAMPLFMWCGAEEILMRLPMGVDDFDGLLSLPGREVLAGLLSYNPCERMTAADALKHRWFTEEEPPCR